MKHSRMLAAAVLCAVGFGITACNDDPGGPIVIPPPANVVVTATGPSTATVTFAAVTGATRYTIQRATGTSMTFDSIGTVLATAPLNFNVTGLVPEQSYQFRVSATTPQGTSAFSSPVAFTASARGAVSITTNITADRTLSADTIYTLVGYIQVADGATLTIPAGTEIRGSFQPRGSSLFILRGARLVVNGTAERPVVFTSSQPVGQRKAGDWGGIIVIGNASGNRAGVTVEGTGINNIPLLTYPGPAPVDNSNSGVFNYMRIEFAGYAVSAGNELNSLSLYAVGSGTQMDYVQILNGLDDAIEWFGGTVDGKHLVSYETGDDHFDMSEGFRGRLQYLIAYTSKVLEAAPNSGDVSSEPHGIENDGCNGAGCNAAFNSTPFTMPVVANFTLVSRNVVGTGTGELGMVLRRGTGGFYVNGVLSRWARAAISIRDQATMDRMATGDLLLSNILVSESPTVFEQGSAPIISAPAIDTVAVNIRRNAANAAALFTTFPAATPTSATAFDWTPATGSPARTGGLTTFTGKLATVNTGNFITPTAYLGAADPAGAKWWAGWTRYVQN